VGKDYQKVSGVCEYCYVQSQHYSVSLNPVTTSATDTDGNLVVAATTTANIIICTIVFELRDANKDLIDTVQLSVDKQLDHEPTVADIGAFAANEVVAFIAQQKLNYSGYGAS
jgi:hypothetical protein